MIRVAAPRGRTLGALGNPATRPRHRPARLANHATAAAADRSAPLRAATVDRAAKARPLLPSNPLRTASAEAKSRVPMAEPPVAPS